MSIERDKMISALKQWVIPLLKERGFKGSTDDWFRYDKKPLFSRGDVFERTAKSVIPYLNGQAEEWWRSDEVIQAVGEESSNPL